MTSNEKRLADLVADFCASKLDASHVFTVTGGGAMYLNDAFGKHPDIEVVPMHHEQSASMAAEGYYRETGKVAVCQVTTGPGGANAITGCAGAWVDSEAIIFISGQVETISLISEIVSTCPEINIMASESTHAPAHPVIALAPPGPVVT